MAKDNAAEVRIAGPWCRGNISSDQIYGRYRLISCSTHNLCPLFEIVHTLPDEYLNLCDEHWLLCSPHYSDVFNMMEETSLDVKTYTIEAVKFLVDDAAKKCGYTLIDDEILWQKLRLLR